MSSWTSSPIGRSGGDGPGSTGLSINRLRWRRYPWRARSSAATQPVNQPAFSASTAADRPLSNARGCRDFTFGDQGSVLHIDGVAVAGFGRALDHRVGSVGEFGSHFVIPLLNHRTSPPSLP